MRDLRYSLFEPTLKGEVRLVIKFESQMPAKCGLGGSAAWAIALSTGIYIGLRQSYEGEINDDNENRATIKSYADYLEKLVNEETFEHSGVDVATIMSGGIIGFLPKIKEEESQE